MIDEDGYPTEEALKRIREWEWSDGVEEWFSFIESIWHFHDWGWHRDGSTYYVSTGGWSGNESIISAMQKNYVLWPNTWVSSRRGGHFEFEIDPRRE